MSLLATGVLAGLCVAQNAQSATSATASGQAAAQAGQVGAQASGNAAADAANAASLSAKNVQAASGAHLQSGSTVQAELEKPLDAKKNKVGDEVIARTTHDVKSDGHVVVPKGSKLVGHVTQVQAHSKDQATSTMGIAFDHAILKNGTQVPMTLGIQAIGHAQAGAVAAADDAMPSAGGGAMASSGGRAGAGGLLGGVGSTAGGVANTATNTAGGAVNSVAGATGGVSGSLSANSQGVVGLPGVSLSSQSATSGNASVLSSQGNNVHLDSGTQMVLQVK